MYLTGAHRALTSVLQNSTSETRIKRNNGVSQLLPGLWQLATLICPFGFLMNCFLFYTCDCSMTAANVFIKTILSQLLWWLTDPSRHYNQSQMCVFYLASRHKRIIRFTLQAALKSKLFSPSNEQIAPKLFPFQCDVWLHCLSQSCAQDSSLAPLSGV